MAIEPKVIKVFSGPQGLQGPAVSISGTGWAHATNGVIDPAASTPTKANVGLPNVDDTSDANKPVSTLQAAALALKLNANDASVTNARAPITHAASHAAAGSDPLTVSESQVTGLTTALVGKLSLDDPQAVLLLQGTRAVVAAQPLAWASLANGQTFVTITPALAADSRTINAALAASTDRPTFCAALALELNTANTTAFVWTVNGTSDGLIGTAETPGDEFNSSPTGTALVGGIGSVTTMGADAAASVSLSPLSLPTGISDSASATAGDIVRIVSAGVLALAQSDTAAHAAGQIGIWNGSTVVPLVGFCQVNCVSLPTVGLPIYVSAATAGKGSQIAPALGANPIGTVVANLSGTPDFKALISAPYQPIAGDSSLLEKLNTETLALLGGSVDDWADPIFDDFGKINNTGYTPTWGYVTGLTFTAPSRSCVKLSPGGGGWYLSFGNGPVKNGIRLLNIPWRLSARYRQALTGYGGIGISGNNSAGALRCHLGVNGGNGHWGIQYGMDASLSYTDCGANDGSTFVDLHLAAPGDGTLLYRGGTVTAWTVLSDAATTALNATNLTSNVFYAGLPQTTAHETDWIYFRQRRD